MVQNFAKRRRYPRRPVLLAMKVYSSLSRGPMTVQATELGQKGAFISAKRFPIPGEVITYQVVDADFAIRHRGEARVVYTCRRLEDGKIGFGIEFETPLTDTEASAVEALQVDLKQTVQSYLGW